MTSFVLSSFYRFYYDMTFSWLRFLMSFFAFLLIILHVSASFVRCLSVVFMIMIVSGKLEHKFMCAGMLRMFVFACVCK